VAPPAFGSLVANFLGVSNALMTLLTSLLAVVVTLNAIPDRKFYVNPRSEIMSRTHSRKRVGRHRWFMKVKNPLQVSKPKHFSLD